MAALCNAAVVPVSPRHGHIYPRFVLISAVRSGFQAARPARRRVSPEAGADTPAGAQCRLLASSARKRSCARKGVIRRV